MLLKKHMWNITGSGHYTLLLAIWPGVGPVWEEGLWETTPVSVFCIMWGQSLAISLPALQLSLFAYLICWRMLKKNRCCVLVPLFYSTPLWGKKKKWTVVNWVVRVYHCNIWHSTLLQSIAFTVSLRKRKRRRKGKWIHVVQVDWPQRHIRHMGMSLNINLFTSRHLLSL